MVLKDVVQWLLDNKYAVYSNEEIVFTPKLRKDLESIPAKKTKRRAMEEEYRNLWKDFVDKAEVPASALAQDGRYYYLRPYSLAGVIELIRILNRKDIKRERLIASTKFYYKNAAFKKTLLNYFRDGLWEEVYNSYIAGPTDQAGENPFEK